MKTGRPKRLKLEQRIELARRYHAGETPKVLAEAYGVSRRHVTRLAKEEQGEGLAVRVPSESVSFRATQTELEAFDAEWQEHCFGNRSQALNAVLRAWCESSISRAIWLQSAVQVGGGSRISVTQVLLWQKR